MSKTVELARHLSTLNINNMYKNDFYWTWDKTDDEIEAIFTVADALRDLRERNKSTRIFDSGLGISLFRDNSTRTRFSFASACNLLGLEEQVLDEKKSQIAHGETVRETARCCLSSITRWRTAAARKTPAPAADTAQRSQRAAQIGRCPAAPLKSRCIGSKSL